MWKDYYNLGILTRGKPCLLTMYIKIMSRGDPKRLIINKQNK